MKKLKYENTNKHSVRKPKYNTFINREDILVFRIIRIIGIFLSIVVFALMLSLYLKAIEWEGTKAMQVFFGITSFYLAFYTVLTIVTTLVVRIRWHIAQKVFGVIFFIIGLGISISILASLKKDPDMKQDLFVATLIAGICTIFSTIIFTYITTYSPFKKLK